MARRCFLFIPHSYSRPSYGPGCVKTHTLKECRKYNSPTRNRAVYPQHDLTLIMRNFFETFYARRRRWSFHTAWVKNGPKRMVRVESAPPQTADIGGRGWQVSCV